MVFFIYSFESYNSISRYFIFLAETTVDRFYCFANI